MKAYEFSRMQRVRLQWEENKAPQSSTRHHHVAAPPKRGHKHRVREVGSCGEGQAREATLTGQITITRQDRGPSRYRERMGRDERQVTLW